jgi:hypothetical protein
VCRVKLGRARDGSLVALKLIYRTMLQNIPKKQEQLNREVQAMQSLQSSGDPAACHFLRLIEFHPRLSYTEHNGAARDVSCAFFAARSTAC